MLIWLIDTFILFVPSYCGIAKRILEADIDKTNGDLKGFKSLFKSEIPRYHRDYLMCALSVCDYTCLQLEL